LFWQMWTKQGFDAVHPSMSGRNRNAEKLLLWDPLKRLVKKAINCQWYILSASSKSSVSDPKHWISEYLGLCLREKFWASIPLSISVSITGYWRAVSLWSLDWMPRG
jgi:hypothetical protein